MSRVGAGRPPRVHQPQVGRAAGRQRRRRPGEVRAGSEIVRRSRTPFRRRRDCVADTRSWVLPGWRNGGPSVTCCVHPTGRSVAPTLSTRSRTRISPPPARPASTSAISRSTKRPDNGSVGAQHQLVVCPLDVERGGRGLAVRRQARLRLVGGRTAEDVEAQVVPHDAGEQAGIGAVAVDRVIVRIVGGGLDRGPRRHPERVHAGFLVEHFGDVAAALEDGDPDGVILERRGAAAVVTDVSHGPLLLRRRPSAAPVSRRYRVAERRAPGAPSVDAGRAGFCAFSCRPVQPARFSQRNAVRRREGS